MADNVDPIVIPIQTDDKDSLMSIAQVQAAIGELSSQLNTLKQQSESPMADYTRDFNQQISFAEQGLTRLLDLRKRVDSATTSTDRTRTTKIFEDEYKRMEAVVGDLQQSMSTSKTLFASLTDGLEKEFANGIKTFAPRIKQAFRQMADSITKSSGTAGDDSLIELFQHSDVYKNTMKSLQARNSTVFSNANMRSYLQSIISTAVPQYDRGKFVDWAKNEYAVKTVREMLPKAFGTIQLSGEKTYSPFQQRTKSLSSSETLALQDFIKKNPYVANELEQAGIMRRYNGVAYFNPNTKRANVNAFAGLMASMFEAGARGGPSSGITNIEDPAFQSKILRKSNMFMDNSMRAASALADMFPWLNPQHMSVPQDVGFRPSINGKPGNWRTLGEFKAKPRQTAMEFYEFGLDELGQDGAIAFKDGKARYTRVNNSLMQSMLSSRKGATQFAHNGFNNNEVYLSLPVEELSNFETTKERREEIQKQIASAIGQTPTIGGHKYRFGGFTPTHAVFERADLYDQIVSEDPNFFMNGEDRRIFGNYTDASGKTHRAFQDFSKALEATRKLRTEGEDIRSLYGSDLSNAKVVVARMKDITGLDGQNWIDSSLVPESFQGRNYGGKATFSKINIASLWEKYPQLVDKATGNLVLPTGGINGGQLIIPRGTSIIEDIENIKTKHQYEGLSQAEINAMRTKEVQEKGIFAKTTADAATTNPRFISSQAAGTMHFGPEARRYFNNVFLHELASLEDVGSVKELLFSGSDALSQMVQADEGYLNSPEARQRIDEYRESLFAHAGKGDILIPRGSANYAMISAWLPDVMARLIPEDQLTEEQKSWRLADISKKTGLVAGSGAESEDVLSKVAYFASKADELGLYRNPATASGNIKLSNAAIDTNMQSIAKALGVDTSALYVDPKSVILGLMQGADEDGDTAFVTALKGNKEFGNIMSQVLVDTATAYKHMRELGGRTDAQQEQIKKLHTSEIGNEQSEYSIENLDDVANWWVGSKLAGMRMGTANAVSVGARQFRPSQRITRAILDAESHYDIDSTGRLKSGQEWDMTADEKRVLYSGAPFFQLANWAKKSTTNDVDEQGKQRIIFDQDAFNKRAIDKVNFSSIHDTHALLNEYSSFMSHLMNPDAKSEFDWDAIFGALPQVDSNTAAGKLTSRLRDLKRGRLNNEFLFFDDDVIQELTALKSNAAGEIANEVMKDEKLTPNQRQIEYNKRLAAAGGDVVDHLIQFGLTRRNIESNKELKDEFDFIQSLTEGTGINLFANAKDYTVSTDGPVDFSSHLQRKKTEVNQQIKQAEIQREQKQQKLEELQQTVMDSPSYEQDKQSYQDEIKRLDDQIANLSKQRETINKQEGYNQIYEAVQAEYNRLMSDAGSFSSDLFKSVMSKQNKLDGVSKAQTFYNSQHGVARAYTRQIEDLLMNAPASTLTENQYKDLMRLTQRINTNVDKEFAAKAILNSKYLSEDLEQKAAPAGGIWGKQEQQLEAYAEKLKEAEEYKKILLGLADDPNTDDKSKDEFKEAANRVDEYLKHASDQYDKYKEKLIATNAIIEAERINKENAQVDQFIARGDQMSFAKSGVNRNDFISRVQLQQQQTLAQYASYISSGQSILSNLKNKQLDQAVGSKEWIATANNIEKVEAALARARVEMDSFTRSSGLAKIALANLGAATANVIKRFGHQMFQKAITEAKRFVQEYDKDMTTIQMITLKSDSEIDKLGQSLIQKAVDMRASVSETTSAAGELYRQGLSDEEVNTRLEDVIKFSKVAGIKTTEASKIITTALQNGLVDSSEDAMDALVALGDSAATTASEIAKGMQKTAASAKQAGISYSQLVTLLTIGTSKTQLGGSAIGSALQTLFYRLQKVGKKEDFYDENGKHIASNDAMKAIEGLGISAFDTEGNMRNPYEVLVDIASKWDTADDVTQSKILTTLGAGRQRSNVATLIQGLSEDNGELAGKYNDLASNSKGITDEKYQEYLKSLEASITSVKTSFDQLIASFNAGSTASTVLGFIAELIQGFTAVNTALGGMPSLITAIAVAAAGLIALFKFSTPIGWITTIAAGAAVAIGGIGSLINNANKASEEAKKQEKNQFREEYENIVKLNSGSLGSKIIIDETRALGEEYEKLGDTMDETKLDKFKTNLESLKKIFPELGSNISESADILDSWKDIVDGATLSAEKIIEIKNLEAAKEVTESNIKDLADKLEQDLAELDAKLAAKESLSEFGKEDIGFDAYLSRNLNSAYTTYEDSKADFTIQQLTSELTGLIEQYNIIKDANIGVTVSPEAKEYVDSMNGLLTTLNNMPDDGYDLSFLENLSPEELASQFDSIKSGLEAIDKATSQGVISQETANAMKAPLETALTQLQTAIDNFNANNADGVNVKVTTEGADTASETLKDVAEGPYNATVNTGTSGTDEASSKLDSVATNGNQGRTANLKAMATNVSAAKSALNTTAKEREAPIKAEATNTDVASSDIDAVASGRTAKIGAEADQDTLITARQAIQSGVSGITAKVKVEVEPYAFDGKYNTNYTPKDVETAVEESKDKSKANMADSLPSLTGLSEQSQNVINDALEAQKNLKKSYKVFLNALQKDPSHNLDLALNTADLTKEQLITALTTKSISGFIGLDTRLDQNSSLLDVRDILNEIVDFVVTVNSIGGKTSSGLRLPDSAWLIASAGGSDAFGNSRPNASSKTQSLSDEVLTPYKINFAIDNFGNGQIYHLNNEAEKQQLDDIIKFYAGFLGTSFRDIHDNYTESTTNWAGYINDNERKIKYDELYDKMIAKMQSEQTPYYYLLLSYADTLGSSNRYGEYNGLQYTIADQDMIKQTEEILRYIYEKKLTGNTDINQSVYNNVDDFLSDWDNSFNRLEFTSDSGSHPSPLNYITGLFESIVNPGSNEYKEYIQELKDQAAYNAFEQMFGVDETGKSVVAEFDRFEDKDILKDIIKNVILQQHIGEHASDWINPNDLSSVVSIIDQELLQYINDRAGYIANKATEAMASNPGTFVKTAIDLFNEKNGTKNAADALFKEITESGITTLEELVKGFEDKENPKFKDLYSVVYDDKNGTLASVINSFSDENGEKVIDDNGTGLKAFLTALAGLTGLYTDAADKLMSEKAGEGLNFLTAFLSGEGGNTAYYDSLSSLIGKTLANKINIANMSMISDAEKFNKGNINLFNRKPYIYPDGTIATVESFSFQDDDGKEVLLPSIIDGKKYSEERAIAIYKGTGQYLGKFDTVEEANAYAEALHKQQERTYGANGTFYGITPFELNYAETILNNAANGISGLTDMQQYEGIRQLINLVSSGGFDYNSIDSKVLGAYTSGSKTLNDYLIYSSKLSEAGLDASKLGDIDPLTEEYKKYDNILRQAGTTAHTFIETQKELNKELAVDGVNATNAYGNRTKEVTSIMSNMKGSVEEASKEQQNLNKILTSISNNQYWRNKWKAGDKSDETLKGIASMLNIPQDQIDQWGEKYINAMLESLEITDMSSIRNYTDALSETIELELNEAAKKPIILEATGIELYGGEVSYNFTEALAKLNGIIDEFEYEILAQLAAAGVDGIVNIFTDKEGNIHARIEPKTLGRGRANGRLSSNNSNRNGSSGSNGSTKKEKTPAEKLTEALKNRQTLWDHRIKMVQFQQTYYEEDDQLGNYGRMIEAENAIRKEMGPALEENLRQLKAEFAQTAQNTKEWYTLRDAILSAEEAIEDNNQAIEKNNKKLKQNEYNIHKRRIELEDLVREEIKRRIQEERDKVQGSSDLEKEIYNIIKSNYEKQWQLIKDDIDKKKEALNEEKNLINERLNARKKAEDTASKYEQLAEYKKQLALIQMDKTRTKEAAALRKKIAELQGTIGWNIAEEEAKNQQDEIDQQVKAYDDYEKQGDKALNDFLADANNLAAEIKQVMSLNHDDLIIWLKTNSDDYKNSLENTRQTIQFGWDDLYNKAHGIVETFNEQIAAILTNQETYIEFMSQSSEYLRATSDAQANMVQDWLDKYDAWYKTQDHSVTYIHNDNNYYSSGDVIDTDNGSSGYSGGSGGSGGYSDDGGSYEVTIPTSRTIEASYRGKKGVGKTKEEALNALISQLNQTERNAISSHPEYVTYTTISGSSGQSNGLSGSGSSSGSSNTSSNSSGSSGSSSGNNTTQPSYTKTIFLKYATNGKMSDIKFVGTGSTDNDALKDAYNKAVAWIKSNNQQLNYYIPGFGVGDAYPEGYTASYAGMSVNARTKNMAYEDLIKTFENSTVALTRYQDLYNSSNVPRYSWYKYGGLVDYTGPAWVDGTPSNPEAFLSAPDTKLMRNFLDALSYVPNITRFDPSMFMGNYTSGIDNVSIVINEATINDELDIEILAEKIGQQFNRELEKQGFSTAKYRF